MKPNKEIIEVVIIIGVVFLIFLIFKKIGKFITDPIGTGAATEALQESIDVDKTKLTYPNYQYKTWAEALKIALLGDIDEDEEVVKNIIFQIQNDNDIAQLISDFGVVNSTPFGIPLGHNYDLVSAINNLTPELVGDFNYHFNGWGMKFRF